MAIPEYSKNVRLHCSCNNKDNVALVSLAATKDIISESFAVVWCSCGQVYALQDGKATAIHSFCTPIKTK